ncbi:MAG: ATPase, partial [Haloarculaceae archaeon]
ILIVDIDGEYYGLKEEYEILHVGADEECDIQVTVEHAEKIAALALEQNVPIILDVSSFLDEGEAETLLTEVSKQLFAKEKKLKQPFLMLVEECHEWIPEKGSVSECGKMLIKIGKRGRKHGLGIVGISQRPADVKKDFITQCDWLVWHRLTWNNDTKVVSRILDAEYSDAVEDLDDGEAFMMTDWSESVRRVQFQRKTTFDAGATPGLDDVDRPDLKSVSSDLVSELEEISDQKQQTEDRIKELREELDKKNSRIAELETELQDARDLSRMADQFVDALMENANGVNPGRTEQAKMREFRRRQQGREASDDASADAPSPERDTGGEAVSGEAPADEQSDDTSATTPTVDAASDDGDADDGGADGATATDAAIGTTDDDVSDDADAAAESDAGTASAGATAAGDGGTIDVVTTADATADDGGTDGPTAGPADDDDVAAAMASMPGVGLADDDPTDESGTVPPERREVVVQLCRTVESMPAKTRGMLRYYRKEGPTTPLDAHFAAGGEGDRTNAYAHNRTLRTHGFIEHVGRGKYDYRLADLLREEYDGRPGDEELDALVAAVEDEFVK